MKTILFYLNSLILISKSLNPSKKVQISNSTNIDLTKEILEKLSSLEKTLSKTKADLPIISNEDTINHCNGNGIFTNKKCFCNPGYEGSDCKIQTTCINNCSNNGICKYGQCFCYPGYYGGLCQNTETCLNNCSSNGICKFGKCFCYFGYIGEDCSFKLACPNNCSNRGICYFGECICESGFTGPSCQNITNDNICENLNFCNNNGLCSFNKCICFPGYKGDSCEKENECFNKCNLNGICISDGECRCKKGYEGKYCEIDKSISQKVRFTQIKSESTLEDNSLISKNFNSTKLINEELFGYTINYQELTPYTILSILLITIALSVLLIKNND